jgi:hypothetical protein
VRRVAAVLLALSTLLSCSQEPGSGPQRKDPNAIVIGSFNFTENHVIAEIYASVLDSHGYPVARLNWRREESSPSNWPRSRTRTRSWSARQQRPRMIS